MGYPTPDVKHTELTVPYISSHLKEQLVYLRWQCLLEDSKEGVRLTAHRHSQTQVLHAVLHVALRQQLLPKLHLKNE